MTSSHTRHIVRGLAAEIGADRVLAGTTAAYLADATEARGLAGHAHAIAVPATAEDVAAVVAWCYENDVPMTPRGGGTGFAGGAVPSGGVVVATDALTRVRSFDPLLWRMEVEAGVRTNDVRRLARENGLSFPPDPGAGEQSHIGGNVATNAGGPHAFKYGVTGAWTTGLEAALAPGELVSFGGSTRKDVAGYDLKSLLIGSEGTLGIVTAARLKLIPAPEAAIPVVAFYRTIEGGCAAIEAVLGNGITASALEYLDGGTVAAAAGGYPGDVPVAAAFMVIAEADGTWAEAERVSGELREVLGDGALAVETPPPTMLWRWRDGVSITVTGLLGGKISEDIAVPLDRLGEAIEATIEIGRRHGLAALSWGHAGDGNLHSTFLVRLESEAEVTAAERASIDLFELSLQLGGTVSGEHGLGIVKRGHARWPPRTLALHAGIKRVFDPKNLLNPGKKIVL